MTMYFPYFNHGGQTHSGHKVEEPHHIEICYLTSQPASHMHTPIYGMAKSSGMKCHGKKLCGGGNITQGKLCYGHATPNSTYGEYIQWWHW